MKTGRPKAKIDWAKVDRYLQAHCDGSAIARILAIHPDTLYKAVERTYKMTFSAYAQEKKMEGIALVEASVFKDAINKGGVDRIFWLKNKAGWKDKQDVEHSGIPQTVNIVVDSEATKTALNELRGDNSKAD